MSELYWISVLGTLNGMIVTAGIISIFVTIASALFYPAYSFGFSIDKEREKECEKEKRWCRKTFKCALITSVVCMVLHVFTPTKTELYMIYGVGGIIDYVQDNKTASEIPDKVIKVLDKWAESLTEDTGK